MISVHGLSKSYGEIQAVKDVSFTIEKGQIVGLVGHNGAGKTTLMKMITGFLEPTEGQVEVGGISIATDRIGVQAQIGYLPESAPLYPEMVVQEYLLMMAAYRGIAEADLERAVAESVRATGLQARLLQPIGTLSRGFKQRVGLAQAIVHRPDVLILDEPTSGLDPKQLWEIRALIRRLAQDATVIFSSHIMQEIAQVCDRVIFMVAGEVAEDQTISEMEESDEISVSVRGDGARERLASLIDEQGWQMSTLEKGRLNLETVYSDILQNWAKREGGAA